MPRSKISPIKNFILEALISSTYPETIFIDPANQWICIRLLNQHKKDRAIQTTQMLKDYAKLRIRRDNTKTSDRQRFLQALKRSPYIVVHHQSTADMKYIYFIDGGGNFPELGPVAGPSANDLNDAAVVPGMMNEDPMEILPISPLLHEEEMEDINLPPDVLSSTSSSPLADLENVDLMDLDSLVAANEALTDYSASVSRQEVSDSVQPDLVEHAALESSFEVVTDWEEIPNDYDPTEDYLKSCTSTRSFPQQEVCDAVGNSSSQRLDITGVQYVVPSENGFVPLEVQVDECELDDSCHVVISLIQRH